MAVNPLHDQVVAKRARAENIERLESVIGQLDDLILYTTSLGATTITANLQSARDSLQTQLANVLNLA